MTFQQAMERSAHGVSMIQMHAPFRLTRMRKASLGAFNFPYDRPCHPMQRSAGRKTQRSFALDDKQDSGSGPEEKLLMTEDEPLVDLVSISQRKGIVEQAKELRAPKTKEEREKIFQELAKLEDEDVEALRSLGRLLNSNYLELIVLRTQYNAIEGPMKLAQKSLEDARASAGDARALAAERLTTIELLQATRMRLEVRCLELSDRAHTRGLFERCQEELFTVHNVPKGTKRTKGWQILLATGEGQSLLKCLDINAGYHGGAAKTADSIALLYRELSKPFHDSQSITTLKDGGQKIIFKRGTLPMGDAEALICIATAVGLNLAFE